MGAEFAALVCAFSHWEGPWEEFVEIGFDCGFRVGSVLFGLCFSLILVTGVFIFAPTSRLASDLFFLLAISGLLGSFSDRILSFATVSQFFDMISFSSVWQSFSFVGNISGGCVLSFGCLFSSCVLFSNCILSVVSFISDRV